MKIKNLLFIACLSILFITTSCESDDLLLESNDTNITGKRKPKGGGGTTTSTSLQKGTYTVINVENPSALYQFTYNRKRILLQSDPNAGTWGTDYFGFWSDAYSFSGNKIQYTSGLSTIIYDFNVQSNGGVLVVRTVITASYQSNGETTTTVTNLGTYSK